MEKLSNRLKEERIKRNYTQKQVADILHIDRVTYTNWELGKHKPDIDQLTAIADYYKISIDYLTGRF